MILNKMMLKLFLKSKLKIQMLLWKIPKLMLKMTFKLKLLLPMKIKLRLKRMLGMKLQLQIIFRRLETNKFNSRRI